MATTGRRENTGERRFLGAVWLIAGIISLIIAITIEPLSEWMFFGWLLGAATVLLVIVGAWMLITGNGNVLSARYSARTQETIAIVGLIAATVVIIGNVHFDETSWSSVDVLSIGVWISIGFMFLVSLRAALRAARSGA